MLAALAAVGVLACAGAEARAVWTTTVDTLNAGAGPVVVVNTPPPDEDGSSPTWRFEETLRIGGVEEGPSSQLGVMTDTAPKTAA